MVVGFKQPEPTLLSYLQNQGDAGREEGHKHKVVGQDGHAAEAAHDLQLPHSWNRRNNNNTTEPPTTSSSRVSC